MATEPQTMFFPMNVVQRKTRQVKEERRKIKQQLENVFKEMRKLEQGTLLMGEGKYKKYTKLVEESRRLENMPEPEVEISLADLTREEFEQVQFTDWGWQLRLSDDNILQVATKQKAFKVLTPRNRCAQSSRY